MARRRIGARLLRWLLAAGLSAGLAAIPANSAHAAEGQLVTPDASGELPDGWFNSQWGPYGPAGVSLLRNVRLANLWEGEGAGPLGARKGHSARVREVGRLLAEQHAELERRLVPIARRLDIDLPTKPNPDQMVWLSEMNGASGPTFDQIWVDRLRAAHGKVFSLIATVRANTRNSLIRGYAEAANNAVATHMDLLESTGLVRYNDLPTPAAPAAAKNAVSQTVTTWSSDPHLAVLALLAVFGATALVAVWMLRSRPLRRRRHGSRVAARLSDVDEGPVMRRQHRRTPGGW